MIPFLPADWEALALKALAALFVALALFGAGYYVATRQYDTAAANAAQAASAAATKAQAAKDAKDYAADKADMTKRQAANKAAAGALQVIYRDRKVLVPSPAVCVVPKAAMQRLNDPALVGSN